MNQIRRHHHHPVHHCSNGIQMIQNILARGKFRRSDLLISPHGVTATPEQLRFPPVDGLTVRGDFDGGALSSDFGPMILRGVDRHIGLTERLAAAFDDKRHPSYITHGMRGLLAQRIYQVACAYEDGNDANECAQSRPGIQAGAGA